MSTRGTPCEGPSGALWPEVGAVAGHAESNAGFLNEQQLADARATGRRLERTNEFAINGHENRVNYIVGTGHSYKGCRPQGRRRAERGRAARAGRGRHVSAREPLASAAAGDRPPPRPRRRGLPAEFRRCRRRDARAVRRAEPGLSPGRTGAEHGRVVRHRDRSRRRRDCDRLLDRRAAGRRGGDSAPQAGRPTGT